MASDTEKRIWREARRMLRHEQLLDFINNFRQYRRRLSGGYYEDRLVQIHRWLINDEQQAINEYYGKQ